MTGVLDALRHLLVERFDADPEMLSGDVTLARAGVDSLAAVDLIVAIEQRFGITLGEQDLDQQHSLTQLAGVIDRLLVEKSG